MKISILDAATLGADLPMDFLYSIGEVVSYETTASKDIQAHIGDSDVVIINKIRLTEENLRNVSSVKLICVAATGYDNIDIEYCRKRGIAVCNVKGYSSHSVALVTVSTVLTLATHLISYNDYVKSGDYSKSGLANCLTPVYHELYGKIWGIVGYGSIGQEVGRIAEAFGCHLLFTKNTPIADKRCVSVESLCREADIITLHTPLTEKTRHLISFDCLSVMKPTAILYNAARGAVVDEAAVARFVEEKKIAAFGTDVYSCEPFGETHPYSRIKALPNVCLTPHMAWGAYEARLRCMEIIAENIRSFYSGGIKNRVDIC